jgi:hypothetical protein
MFKADFQQFKWAHSIDPLDADLSYHAFRPITVVAR